MRLERGDLIVRRMDGEPLYVIVQGKKEIQADLADLRWLLTCALPAAIVDLAPTDERPAAPVGDQLPLGG